MDDFREEMLHDTRLQILVDYPNAADCFPGIDLSGGVCYFLWNSEYNGICKIVSNRGKDYQSTMNRPLLEPGNDTFIRFNEAIPIIRKIIAYKEPTFDSLVSPQTPFGIVSSFKDYSDKPFEESIAIYTVNGIKYIREDQVSKNRQARTKFSYQNRMEKEVHIHIDFWQSHLLGRQDPVVLKHI